MKISAAHLAAFALLAWSANMPAALAATATTSFTVTTTVPATCSVTATNLSFPDYLGAAVDGESAITVKCTNTTAYTVGLDDGANPSGTQRRMTSGGNTLNYELYSNSGRTTRWGNASGSWVAGTGNGTNQTLPVYGQIPAGQNLYIGSYLDTINVTVTY